MIRRAKLWLLYQVARMVWKERKTFEEFARFGHRKYADRANPYLYENAVVGPSKSFQYSDTLYDLQMKLGHFDDVAEAIAKEASEIESKILRLYRQECEDEWNF